MEQILSVNQPKLANDEIILVLDLPPEDELPLVLQSFVTNISTFMQTPRVLVHVLRLEMMYRHKIQQICL